MTATLREFTNKGGGAVRQKGGYYASILPRRGRIRTTGLVSTDGRACPGTQLLRTKVPELTWFKIGSGAAPAWRPTEGGATGPLGTPRAATAGAVRDSSGRQNGAESRLASNLEGTTRVPKFLVRLDDRRGKNPEAPPQRRWRQIVNRILPGTAGLQTSRRTKSSKLAREPKAARSSPAPRTPTRSRTRCRSRSDRKKPASSATRPAAAKNGATGPLPARIFGRQTKGGLSAQRATHGR